jgi:hypothetical protein
LRRRHSTIGVNARDAQSVAGSIQHLSGKLYMLTARLPFETPPDLADVLREAHDALALHGFVPAAAGKRTDS